MSHFFLDDWKSAPRDLRGIPLTLGFTNPVENMHLQKLKNIHDTTTKLSVNERREVAISYALSNFQIKDNIPREEPTVLRHPTPLLKKHKPRGVLRARSRYPLPYHIGTHANVKKTIHFRSVLLLLLRNTHAKKPFTNKVLARIKDTILFYTPKQLYIAHKYAMKMLGSHNLPSLKTDTGSDSSGNSNSNNNKKKGKNKTNMTSPRASKRRKVRQSPREKDEASNKTISDSNQEVKRMTPEELVEKEHAFLKEINTWTSWTRQEDLRIADIKIGNLIDFYDVGTGSWYQARALKETRRGVIIHLIWPIKQHNNQVLLQKEHLNTLVRPLFTHSNYLINEHFLNDIPSFEREIVASHVDKFNNFASGSSSLSSSSLSSSLSQNKTNGLHRLYVSSSSSSIVADGSGTSSRRPVLNRPRNNKTTTSRGALISSDLVGKEVLLGESYNVKKMYIGKHAIVLGTGQSSGGWVDICIVNSDGTEGDHLRWRLQGLLQLKANKQRKISKRNLISQVIRTYYKNDEEQMKKILLNV